MFIYTMEDLIVLILILIFFILMFVAYILEKIKNIKEKIKLNLINNQIEIYKKNAIEEIQKEDMIPATSSLLILRDLKEQQLLIKDLLKKED